LFLETLELFTALKMGYVSAHPAIRTRPVRGFCDMWTKWIRRAALLLAAAFILNISFYLLYPNVSRLKRERPEKTAFMEYRERQWEKAGLRRHIQQTWVPFSAISPYAVKAVIIAEDDKFWSHEGFDFDAIQKAIEKDLKKKRFKVGGSTISQQLAKNLYLTPAKNPIRKLKEAILTWRLERNLSKRRIIEIYMNVAEWGNGIFGIEAAARHYFGKGAGALTAREAAALAVVLPSPLRYNPVGGSRYVESRTEAVYRIMVRRGIAIPDYDEMLNEPISDELSPESPTGDVANPDVTNAPAMEEPGAEKETSAPTVTGAEGEKAQQLPADARQ
jgi:monofunctional biosynthetic peptidoglycan transglycosylase